MDHDDHPSREELDAIAAEVEARQDHDFRQADSIWGLVCVTISAAIVIAAIAYGLLKWLGLLP